MTTETVCVPRDELSELLQDGVDDYWITTEDGARIVDILRSALAQSVASEPVAWQWLNTAHFRRKIPKHANACHWEPLYRHPPAPAIPEGYVLVPIEPTEAMRDAGNIYSLNRATLMRIWADMIAAAPQPTHGVTDR